MLNLIDLKSNGKKNNDKSTPGVSAEHPELGLEAG